MSVDYSKLKTNLNLIMHRLKLVEKKKMELNQKARRTVGEFLNAGKVDRARIRVEQIIREDYLIEAMDLVESYCDFLLSRFGQLQASGAVDDGLATAVSSIIWVTPRFENDIPELKVINEQLGRKYGKPYVLAVKDNSLNTVNETLVKKMSIQAPPKLLVEKYLVEIAKDQKIDYKPDSRIMKEQETMDSSRFRTAATNYDDDRANQSDQLSQGPGFNLIDLGDHYPRNLNNQYNHPPPLPSEPPTGSLPFIGPAETSSDVTDASAPTAQMPIGFNLPSMNSSSNSSLNQSKSQVNKRSGSTSKLDKETGSEGPPPNYESVMNRPGNSSQYYSFAQDSSFASQYHPEDDLNDTLPELPPVPKDGNEDKLSSPTERLDFEDLTRRFEELKNKKV